MCAREGCPPRPERACSRRRSGLRRDSFPPARLTQAAAGLAVASPIARRQRCRRRAPRRPFLRELAKADFVHFAGHAWLTTPTDAVCARPRPDAATEDACAFGRIRSPPPIEGPAGYPLRLRYCDVPVAPRRALLILAFHHRLAASELSDAVGCRGASASPVLRFHASYERARTRGCARSRAPSVGRATAGSPARVASAFSSLASAAPHRQERHSHHYIDSRGS